MATRGVPARVDRLELLIRMLRDRPGATAGELAAELRVSERSVFRDIATLRERGLPVEADRGRGGGLRLRNNWGLGRVLLSREEALCALLGLAIAEKLGFPMFAPMTGRARSKIVDAFPPEERRQLAPLRERIFIGGNASAAVRASYVEPSAAPMRQLQVAFVRLLLVDAEYVREDGRASRRRLEPHALLINWPAWYLLAVDVDLGAPRTFRLDRFLDVRMLTESFHSRAVSMAQEMLGAAGVATSRV